MKELRSWNKVAVMALAAVAIVLAVNAPGQALAMGGHSSGGGHPGGGFHGGVDGHHGFDGHHDFARHHDFDRRHFDHGFGFGLGFAYPYDYYPYDGYWYYCPSYGAYYPYAGTCPEPWVPVPAS